MKTVTDAEFRKNLGEMLEYLRSGGKITVVREGHENIALSGSDLSPEYLTAYEGVKKHRERMGAVYQQPQASVEQELENKYPNLFAASKKALSFEDAMKRTREKHAEIIKRLEDN